MGVEPNAASAQFTSAKL